MRARSTLGLVVALLLLAVSGADAAITTVNSTADHGADACDSECTLRDAIAAAQPNDTIAFAANVTGTITLTTGALVIGKPLVIAGPGARLLAVSGNNASRVFFINRNITATISGLTVRDGAAGSLPGLLATERYGGGIFNDGNLTLLDCRVTANVAGADNNNGAAEGAGIMNYIASTLVAR